MANSLTHLLIAFLVLALMTFLVAVGVLSPVLDYGRVISSALSTPIAAVFSVADNTAEVITQAASLSEENEILTQQVAELSAELAVFEQTEKENQELREALGFSSSSSFDLIPAEVITIDPISANQSLIINRGTRHGVETGSPAVIAGNILIGVVQAAFENTSSIKLITSSDININAQTSGSTATGIIKGEHGLGLLFDLVSQNEQIDVGDRVVTSGLGEGVPKGLYIGEVSEIRTSSSELFQKASVVPGTSLKKVRTLFIVK